MATDYALDGDPNAMAKVQHIGGYVGDTQLANKSRPATSTAINQFFTALATNSLDPNTEIDNDKPGQFAEVSYAGQKFKLHKKYLRFVLSQMQQPT